MLILQVHRLKEVASVGLCAIGFKLASLCKISFIVGSQMAFFSGVNVLHPLAGRFCGASGSCLLFGMLSAIRLLYGVHPSVHFIYGIPGLCAALYMSSPHIVIRLILPIACMILFIAHPVGFYASPYSFYWLIPIFLYFVKKKSFFTESLGSTFIAHAVGSVFWLYLIPMPVSYWWGLLPIVALERLVFASGAVLVYNTYNVCSRYATHLIGFSWTKKVKKYPFV